MKITIFWVVAAATSTFALLTSSLETSRRPRRKNFGYSLRQQQATRGTGLITGCSTRGFRAGSAVWLTMDKGDQPKKWSPFFHFVRDGFAKVKSRCQHISKRAKRLLVLLAVAFVVMLGFSRSLSAPTSPMEIPYSRFLDIVERQGSHHIQLESQLSIDRVRIGNDRISYRLRVPNRDVFDRDFKATRLSTQQLPFVPAFTRKVTLSPDLLNSLRKSEVQFTAATKDQSSLLSAWLRGALLSFYFVILWRLYRTVSGAGGGGRDVPGKLARKESLNPASFDDIEGIDQAKEEVMELVDILRNPEKYAIMGARAPKGLLLEGPPGVGKTLLARATAASAGVPLLYCSGSDFVEMFVGRGAARIRNLFERASKMAPALIFIDELDSLGRSRDTGTFSRLNDEAEQTLNQLLACMDGLDNDKGVCVLAATNRREVLDPALIRPGRFDRIVKLTLPDAEGRRKILRTCCKKLPGFLEGVGTDPDRPGSLGRGRIVDLSAIAAATDGFSGAELAFLVNEAAIRAVRRVSSALNKGFDLNDIVPHVNSKDFEESLESFYESRRAKGGVSDLWKNVWK